MRSERGGECEGQGGYLMRNGGRCGEKPHSKKARMVGLRSRT